MDDYEIDGVGVSETSTTEVEVANGNEACHYPEKDTTDGLWCVSHRKPLDEADTGYMNPREPRSAVDEVPRRSELRLKHAQQDTMEGDKLGGALVTYKLEQGEYFHHFEEFGLFEKSLLRDSLYVKQNDQLVTLDGWTVNEMDHSSVVTLFLNLEIGKEHVMLVANHQISTDSFRQITFSLHGFITEEHEDEEKPEEMLRIENFTLAVMPLNDITDEVNISLENEEHIYLNKDLLFVSTRSVDTDRSVRFIRKRRQKWVGSHVQITSTFKQKDAGFVAIDEKGNVAMLPQFQQNAVFIAKYNNWGIWSIKSKYCGHFLAEQNRRLCSIPNDRDGYFVIKPSNCRNCL
ncbi:uncharacterized protein LOC110440943 isoform X1 [Mizuhopecten yessoensis]|nr:uncharacterized protein LOC110440943 isoform X1 [Mizuhopecten yessoensis]